MGISTTDLLATNFVGAICNYLDMIQVEATSLTATERRVREILNSDPIPEYFVEIIKIDSTKLSKQSRYDHMQAMEKLLAYFNHHRNKSIAAAVGYNENGPEDFFDGVDQAEREDMSALLNISPMTAQRNIDIARTLTNHLPITCQSLALGEISANHANVIATQISQIIERGADPIIIAELENTAIAHAETHTPAQLKRKMINALAALDTRDFEEKVIEARSSRFVRLKPEDNGMSTIIALLPAEEAELVMNVINECARRNQDSYLAQLRSKAGGSIEVANELRKSAELSIDLFRADALSELASTYLQKNFEGNFLGKKPVSLQLIMDMATLVGLKETPGQLVGYGPIPAKIARTLAGDAKWQKFIVDPLTGGLIDYGRSVYEPPTALRDFIIARDRTCRFVGCAQPARRCDIDHAIPWEEGGKTTPENMGALCRRHHIMKTHGGWKLKSFADGSCQWESPSGEKFFVPVKPMNEAA